MREEVARKSDRRGHGGEPAGDDDRHHGPVAGDLVRRCGRSLLHVAAHHMDAVVDADDNEEHRQDLVDDVEGLLSPGHRPDQDQYGDADRHGREENRCPPTEGEEEAEDAEEHRKRHDAGLVVKELVHHPDADVGQAAHLHRRARRRRMCRKVVVEGLVDRPVGLHLRPLAVDVEGEHRHIPLARAVAHADQPPVEEFRFADGRTERLGLFALDRRPHDRVIDPNLESVSLTACPPRDGGAGDALHLLAPALVVERQRGAVEPAEVVVGEHIVALHHDGDHIVCLAERLGEGRIDRRLILEGGKERLRREVGPHAADDNARDGQHHQQRHKPQRHPAPLQRLAGERVDDGLDGGHGVT